MPGPLHPRFLLPVLLLLLGLAACSEGGSEDRPRSAVRITVDAHLFGILGRTKFPAFPPTPDDTRALVGRLTMRDDATYEMREAGSNAVLGAGEYALEESGRLSVLLPTTTATQVFRGAFGLEGDTRHWFVTDRVGEAIGLMMGTRVVPGAAPDMQALAGDWHLFSMHVLHPGAGALQDPDDVGRAFGGALTLAADGAFTGEGRESTNSAALLPVTGDAGAFQAFEDGEFEIAVDYGTETRAFRGGGTGQAIFGTDPEGNGAAGLLVMLRHRTGTHDPARLEGRWILGLWTLFLRPTASGFDSAIGELELTRAGNWRLTALNNQGQDFAYNGTYTAADDGALNFTVAGTNETWSGAFDQDYATLVVVDHFKEQRSNGQIEINFGIALREKTPPPQ